MSTSIRKATLEDVSLLIRVIDMASEGLIPMFWEEMAPDDMDGAMVGRALVAEEGGDFSYRSGLILEQDGMALGGMIGYVLLPKAGPVDPEIPQAFVGIEELAHLVPGHWYINVMAILQEARGKGLGTALLDEAVSKARSHGCPGVALIVAATNQGALRTYVRSGFKERARRPFDLADFGLNTTEAILMVKKIA